jgi:hypothetical protein
MESTTYRLPRTGQAPLMFSGQMLAENDGSHQAGREQNRWHALALYRADSGRYVAAIRYHTRWQGEIEHDEARICDSPAEAAEIFRLYDPAVHVQGYPPGVAYEERQARLISDLVRRYQSQVSEILDRDEFAENV